MSLHISELLHLHAAAGPLLRRYAELLRRRDASAHDSPAAHDLADFLKRWHADPDRLRLECEISEDQAELAERRGEVVA